MLSGNLALVIVGGTILNKYGNVMSDSWDPEMHSRGIGLLIGGLMSAVFVLLLVRPLVVIPCVRRKMVKETPDLVRRALSASLDGGAPRVSGELYVENVIDYMLPLIGGAEVKTRLRKYTVLRLTLPVAPPPLRGLCHGGEGDITVNLPGRGAIMLPPVAVGKVRIKAITDDAAGAPGTAAAAAVASMMPMMMMLGGGASTTGGVIDPSAMAAAMAAAAAGSAAAAEQQPIGGGGGVAPYPPAFAGAGAMPYPNNYGMAPGMMPPGVMPMGVGMPMPGMMQMQMGMPGASAPAYPPQGQAPDPITVKNL